MKQLVLLFGILLFTIKCIGSPQRPDYIIYENDTTPTYNLILESYLQNLDSSDVERLFGLSFRDGASFTCWRGYQAIYKIESDSLFLVDIINCGEHRNNSIDKQESIKKMTSIFNDKVKDNSVYIDWFSGRLNFPLTDSVLRWDGVFYRIFEEERIINISQGIVIDISDVKNYQAVPNGINRRNKFKVSDILFSHLEKLDWSNENEFDCSERYLIKIDETGKISGVRMLLSEEEIQEFYEEAEYNYCINKVKDGLKELQFDILKDKGLPISEEIYLKIWIEDNGKIKNWTH